MTRELKLLLSIATVSAGATVALAIPSKEKIEKNKLNKEIAKVEAKIRDKKNPLSENKINKLNKEIIKAKEMLKKSRDASLISSTKDNFIKATSAIINSIEPPINKPSNPINNIDISKLEKTSAQITGLLFDDLYTNDIKEATYRYKKHGDAHATASSKTTTELFDLLTKQIDKESIEKAEKADLEKQQEWVNAQLEAIKKLHEEIEADLIAEVVARKEKDAARITGDLMDLYSKWNLDLEKRNQKIANTFKKSSDLAGELFDILTKQIDKESIEKAEKADLEKQQEWVDAYLDEIKKLNEEIAKDIVPELIKEIEARMYRDSVSGLDIEFRPSAKDIEKENKYLEDKIKEILDKNLDTNRAVWNEIFAASDTKKIFDDTYTDLTKEALDRYKKHIKNKHIKTHINESAKLTGELFDILTKQIDYESIKKAEAADLEKQQAWVKKILDENYWNNKSKFDEAIAANEIAEIFNNSDYLKELEKKKRDKEISSKIYNDSPSGLDIDIHWTEEDLERAKNKILKENWDLNKIKLDEIKAAKTSEELFDILTKQIDKESIEKAEKADLEKQQEWVDAYLDEIKKLNEEIAKDVVSELIKEIKARMYRDSVSGLDIEFRPSAKDIEKENKYLEDKIKEILDKNLDTNRAVWNEIFAASDTKKIFDDTYTDLKKEALDKYKYKKHIKTHINESAKLTGELFDILTKQIDYESIKKAEAADLEKQQEWVKKILDENYWNNKSKFDEAIAAKEVAKIFNNSDYLKELEKKKRDKEIFSKIYNDSPSGLDIDIHWTEEDLERAKNKILKENWDLNKIKLDEIKAAKTSEELFDILTKQIDKESIEKAEKADLEKQQEWVNAQLEAIKKLHEEIEADLIAEVVARKEKDAARITGDLMDLYSKWNLDLEKWNQKIANTFKKSSDLTGELFDILTKQIDYESIKKAEAADLEKQQEWVKKILDENYWNNKSKFDEEIAANEIAEIFNNSDYLKELEKKKRDKEISSKIYNDSPSGLDIDIHWTEEDLERAKNKILKENWDLNKIKLDEIKAAKTSEELFDILTKQIDYESINKAEKADLEKQQEWVNAQLEAIKKLHEEIEADLIAEVVARKEKDAARITGDLMDLYSKWNLDLEKWNQKIANTFKKSSDLTGELFDILTKQIDKESIEKAEKADLEKQQEWVKKILDENYWNNKSKFDEEIAANEIAEIFNNSDYLKELEKKKRDKEISSKIYNDSPSGLDIDIHWTEEDLERAKNKILKENWEANKPKLNEAISAETTGDLMALWSSQAAKEKPKSTSSDSDENPSRSAAEPLIPKIGDKESEIALGLGNILLKNQGNRDYKKMIHWILDGNHDLWYDRTTRNILVAKKGTIPLGDSYSGPRYEFIKLTKEAYKKLVNNPDGERQLVNANNPIYKRGKYTNLSAMLDYKILNKDEYTDPYLSTTTITFDLEVSYKVGKFVFNGEPLVSDKANKSIINIEYTFTKDGEEEGDEEEIDGDDEEVTPPNDDGDLSPTNPTEPSDPEPEPAPEPEIPESPSLGSGLFKLGHWNILNFTGDDKKQKDKTKRIAILSEKEKFDILGLTEVKNPEGVKKIVDEMNKLSHSNMYSYIASKKEAGSTFNAGSAEAVAIIYNNKKFEPIEFKNGKKGYSYKELFTDFLGEDNAEYARPPYGVQFKYKPKPEKKLTFVFNHFDGPGAKKGEIIKDGLGTFEYREAKQLENVLKEFENLSDDGENIFFGGDTNIILGKEKLAFDWLKKHGGDSGYESVFDDAHRHRSSLGRKGENYTNPYDKIFYKSDFELVNKEVFDLYKVVKGKEFSDLFKKHGVEIKDTKSIWKGGVLSDHTYVTATFKIS